MRYTNLLIQLTSEKNILMHIDKIFLKQGPLTIFPCSFQPHLTVFISRWSCSVVDPFLYFAVDAPCVKNHFQHQELTFTLNPQV